MSKLPKPIQDILQASQESIDERGELTSESRKSIYQRIEAVSSLEQEAIAHVRQAKLQISCAWKTLEKLRDFDTEYALARNLLELSEKCLTNKEEIATLEVASNELYTQLEDLMDEGENTFVAAYAGFACISAANAVMYGVSLDLVGLSEIEVDPDEWTACFYASLAYCGGATWEEGKGDDAKRREFWEWFIHEAVPNLWE